MSEETGHEASTAGINPLDGESVLKNVHPSWINWKGRLFSALFFAIIGAMIGGDAGAFIIVFGLILVFTVFFARRASRYIVTNQRVKVKVGLLGSSTKEARLDTLNGISTSSGFIEGLFGKGTVSVTDAAREEMAIKGVGNYEDLARTLRQQQRQASQPGRAGQQQPAGRQQSSRNQQPRGQQSQNQQSQSQQQAASTNESTTSDSADEDETSREQCLNCESLVDDSVGFCPECGTQNPFTPPVEPTSDDEESGSPADDTLNSPEPDARDHVVVDAADAVANRERPDNDTARELCQVLADPDADRHEIKSTLRAAVGAIEETKETLPEGLNSLGESPTANQLESARVQLSRSDHPAATATLPVIDRAVQLESERDQAETERDRFRETIESLCNAAARSGAVSFTASSPDARGEELVTAIERGDAVIETPGTEWESAAAEIERSHRPETAEAKDLLKAFETNDPDEITASLTAAVEGLEELGELRSGIVDIGERDIRRRIDSLEEELGRADGSVYRHIADRVRELEAMVDEDIDDIQLYAIYQECTFYDRTLIPRLSRSDGSSESVDVARRVRDIEDRIASVNDDYVSVRADHNHTIPKHFLELADTLCDRARRMGDEQPQQAAGQLAAANDLVDHVEELYERNEYSVMLRRLRG